MSLKSCSNVIIEHVIYIYIYIYILVIIEHVIYIYLYIYISDVAGSV